MTENLAICLLLGVAFLSILAMSEAMYYAMRWLLRCWPPAPGELTQQEIDTILKRKGDL